MMIIVSLSLAASIMAVAPPAARDDPIRNPQWARVPTAEELGRFVPSRTDGPREARVRLGCLAKADGGLERCRIISDSARGWGYGEFMLKLMPMFRLKLPLADGRPPAGRPVEIPISFGLISDPVGPKAART